MRKAAFRAASLCLAAVSVFVGNAFPQDASPSVSGKRAKRIVIRGAMMVDGSGKPAAKP